MNTLPKMFCVTLKQTPERRLHASNHFKEHNLDVEFFEGIHAKSFGLHTLIPYMDDQPNWKVGEGTPYYISQGHVGCILSHYILWKVLSYLPYDEFLIFEDDVWLKDNFIEKFTRAKSELPHDWQYVFVGHCCLEPERLRTKISDNVIKTTTPPMCTHAYMIKKTALPVLLDTNHVAWSNIDIQIQKRTLQHLSYYVFYPMLADQKSHHSEYSCVYKTICGG